MACLVVIKRVVNIECGDKRNLWCIESLESINGRECLEVGQRDMGVCKFVAGHDCRKTANMDFLQDLERRKSHAAMGAVASFERRRGNIV